MIKMPLVSVIIPTYNYAHYISEAIDSILNSNFPQDEIEIIIIDDGSTDNTSEVVERYRDKVTYIVQQNSGKAWATKVGIDASTGRYIFNLDADDFFSPRKLRQVVEIFEHNDDVVHVAHPALCWDVEKNLKNVEAIPSQLFGRSQTGKHLLSYFYQRRILFGGGSTFAGRGEVLRRLPITREVDMFIDEFLVLFTLNQGNSFFIQEPLSVWRIHGDNYSSEKNDHYLAQKLERSLASRKAILAEILRGDFETEIQKIYELNLKVMTIAAKEILNDKQITDVTDLWLFLLENYSTFKGNLLSLVKAYTVLNRTLPNFILKPLQSLKHS